VSARLHISKNSCPDFTNYLDVLPCGCGSFDDKQYDVLCALYSTYVLSYTIQPGCRQLCCSQFAGACPLTVATQVLTALRFHATGCMQKDVGDLHGISQPSATR